MINLLFLLMLGVMACLYFLGGFIMLTLLRITQGDHSPWFVKATIALLWPAMAFASLLGVLIPGRKTGDSTDR